MDGIQFTRIQYIDDNGTSNVYNPVHTINVYPEVYANQHRTSCTLKHNSKKDQSHGTS